MFIVILIKNAWYLHITVFIIQVHLLRKQTGEKNYAGYQITEILPFNVWFYIIMLLQKWYFIIIKSNSSLLVNHSEVNRLIDTRTDCTVGYVLINVHTCSFSFCKFNYTTFFCIKSSHFSLSLIISSYIMEKNVTFVQPYTRYI